jgi:hypothetical protein
MCHSGRLASFYTINAIINHHHLYEINKVGALYVPRVNVSIYASLRYSIRRGRLLSQYGLFKGCNSSTRSLMQRALHTATATTALSKLSGGSRRRTLLRLGMIPRTEQGPTLRRRNAEAGAVRGGTHVGVAAHGGAKCALARPEGRGAGAELGDAVDAGGAEAEEVDAGELGVGHFGEVG